VDLPDNRPANYRSARDDIGNCQGVHLTKNCGSGCRNAGHCIRSRERHDARQRWHLCYRGACRCIDSSQSDSARVESRLTAPWNAAGRVTCRQCVRLPYRRRLGNRCSRSSGRCREYVCLAYGWRPCNRNTGNRGLGRERMGASDCWRAT